MDDSTKNMALTLAAGIIKKGLVTLSAGAVTHGVINANQTETFVSAGMLVVGLGWSFWNDYGRAIVLSQLEVLKAKSLAQAAKMKEAGVPPVTVNQIAAASPTLTAAGVTKAISTLPQAVQDNVAKVAAVILFAIFVIGAGSTQPASAQGRKTLIPTPSSAPAICDPLNLIPGCRPSSSAPATDSDQPCDITILTKLTPSNLMPTIKKCVSNVNGTLVNDTAWALDSAKSFTPNPDQDAVNCLAPGLSLFKAGVQVPAVPEAPAVLNADGTVKTPAVAAIPAQDPGPILLFQKYREFTLSGGLTSCQNWVNTPVNATIAAGANAGATAVAGAALLAPK